MSRDISTIEFYQMSDFPSPPVETEKRAREVLKEALESFPDRRFQLWASVEVASVERGMILNIPGACEKLGDFGSYEEAINRLDELTRGGVAL